MGVDQSQLDPDIAQLLQGFAGAGAPVFTLETIGEARAMLDAFPAEFGGTPPEVESVRELSFSNPNAGAELPLKARLYTPATWSVEKGLVLFFHGGGFVMGGLESHDGVCRMLADFGGMAVCAIDYRLAPEHPFPAAVEDCVAAYEWIRSEQGLGVAPNKIAIAGDSAGGNLTAATVLYIKNNNLPMPALQVLLYPSLVMRKVTQSMNKFSEGFSSLWRICFFSNRLISGIERFSPYTWHPRFWLMIFPVFPRPSYTRPVSTPCATTVRPMPRS